jgi:hypothetical protein
MKAIKLALFFMTIACVFLSCKKEKDDGEKPPVLGTCQSVMPKGHLTQTGTGTFIFKTNNGGSIEISSMSITLKHDTYPGFKLEFWGDAGPAGHPLNSANHENLNGKHIKDRINLRRTIIFPDGTKITTLASGYAGPPISISIYDGAESHYINANCNYVNTLEHSSTNTAIAKLLDDAEPDGETSTFEFTAMGLVWVNIYTEDVAGNKVMNRVLLGELNRSNPNQVIDHYDDPRLGHT